MLQFLGRNKRVKTQQAIFVGQHQSPDALSQDQFEKAIKSSLASVQTGTKVGDNLVPPTFGGAKRFEQFLLADQIVLLIVARHAGMAFVAEAQDFTDIVRASTTFAPAIWDRLTRLLPLAQPAAFPILARGII